MLRLNPWIWAPAAVIAVLSTFAVLPRALRTLSVFPISYNEGWLAIWVAAWRDGSSMYPARSDFYVANYTPGSALTYGLLERAFGDVIVAGRIFSWMLLAGICALAALIVARLSHSLQAALLTAITVYATLAVWSGNVGLAEPQLLGHFLALGGVSILVVRPESDWRLVSAALLFLAAGLVKPNVFGFPLGVTIWLFMTQRKRFYGWVAVSLALVATGVLSIYVFSGADSLAANILLGRHTSLLNFVLNLKMLSALIVPIAALALFLSRHSRPPTLLSFCAVGTAIEYVVTAPINGTVGNTAYDFALCLLLIFGSIVGEWMQTAPRLASILTVAFAMRIAIAVAPRTSDIVTELRTNGSSPEDQSFARVIQVLSSIEGPTACSHLTLCYAAGKRARVDLSMRNTLVDFSPPRDLTKVQEQIDQQMFAALELSHFAAPLLDMSKYEIVRAADGITDSVIYVPKRTK